MKNNYYRTILSNQCHHDQSLNHFHCIFIWLKTRMNPMAFFKDLFVSKLKITQAAAAIATSFSFHIFSKTNLQTKMFIKHVVFVWTRLFLNFVGDILRNILSPTLVTMSITHVSWSGCGFRLHFLII